MDTLNAPVAIEPTRGVVKLTYDQIHKLAEYGRLPHGWTTHPIQLACQKLVEHGIVGKLEIYPNNNDDKDGLPDVIYPSIVTAANRANTPYRQKGIDYLST